MRECRFISGVAADVKDSDFMPRFVSYHFCVLGIEVTVRTMWSRDVIFAAGAVIFLICCWK